MSIDKQKNQLNSALANFLIPNMGLKILAWISNCESSVLADVDVLEN